MTQRPFQTMECVHMFIKGDAIPIFQKTSIKLIAFTLPTDFDDLYKNLHVQLTQTLPKTLTVNAFGYCGMISFESAAHITTLFNRLLETHYKPEDASFIHQCMQEGINPTAISNAGDVLKMKDNGQLAALAQKLGMPASSDDAQPETFHARIKADGSAVIIVRDGFKLYLYDPDALKHIPMLQQREILTLTVDGDNFKTDIIST